MYEGGVWGSVWSANRCRVWRRQIGVGDGVIGSVWREVYQSGSSALSPRAEIWQSEQEMQEGWRAGLRVESGPVWGVENTEAKSWGHALGLRASVWTGV